MYESVGYNSNNEWVDLSSQSSYSKWFQYKYSLKIDFTLTNITLRFLSNENPVFIVKYGEETTLQYIYNDAVATSKKYAIPQVEYNISVVDLSSLHDYEEYTPKLGQKIPIFDPEMNFYNFKGFITSINYPLEQKYNTQITIATYNTKFEDVFQKLTATMSNVSYNSNQIYKAADSFEANGAIKTDVFNKSLKENLEKIELGTDNSISMDKVTGITLKDNDTNAGVKLIGNGIFLTQDITQGDNTEWKTGITGEGINASALTAGSIDTKQITIWNSSERQARFIWNEQGLFAYGDYFGEFTSTSTNYQDLINYNKYVKFNQDGLEFNDNGQSALSLGWLGLKVKAQQEALELNATEGLVLKQWNQNHTSFTTRLELGKLNNSDLYGLRLKDPEGKTTVQNSSDGNLWLHQHFRLGGIINNNNEVENATAGIYGLTSVTTGQEQIEVPPKMQMGLRRGIDGNLIWDSTPIRFWAGPQDKNSYITNIHITNNEIENTSGSTNFNSLSTGDPSLAKFKVSANGDIIASGIDVGGWIGQGDKLRSFDNEAILRSNIYYKNSDITEQNPVIAIGCPNKNADSEGKNYNLRIYQDGTINITKGTINIGNNFIVDSTGHVQVKSIDINATQITGLSDIINNNVGNIGGYTNDNSSNNKGLKFDKTNYHVALLSPNSLNDVVFFAGTVSSNGIDNQFYVKANGSVTAKKITILSDSSQTSNKLISVFNANNEEKFYVTNNGEMKAESGTIGGWNINADSLSIGSGSNYAALFPKSDSTSTSPVFYVGSANAASSVGGSGIKFRVSSDGSVFFKGNIYGWYGGKFYRGLDKAIVKLTDGVSVHFVQGLAISIDD